MSLPRHKLPADRARGTLAGRGRAVRSARLATPRPVQASVRDSLEGLSVGQLMGRARSSLIARLDAQLLPFGLSTMHFLALKNLQQGGAGTAAELCRGLGYDTGAMTRILDRLEALGMLQRERSRTDRRRVLLHIAPAGRRLLPRLSAAGERIMDMHLVGFRPAEIATLKSYLSRMIANGTGRGDNSPDHPDTSS